MFKEQLQKLKDIMTSESGRPEKLVTKAYLIALSIIAVLTIGSHVITTNITNAQQRTSEVNYNIGRQRALIQQVAKYTKRYNENKQQLEKDLLIQSIEQIGTSHEFMIKSVKPSGKKGAINSSTLQSFYYEEPYETDKKLKELLQAARDVADPPIDMSEQEVLDKLELIEDTASTQLVNNYDIALEYYQEEATKEISGYYKLQTYTVIFILLTLLIEALFIFQPLVRKLANYNRKLLKMALEDPLTGLNNRRAFINRASSGLQESVSSSATVAVVLTDLDKFKLINDTYGHSAGDEVLKHFSRIMERSLRTYDVTGRIGGEEFAILLPNTTSEEAYKVINRLRKNIESTPCDYDEDDTRKNTLSYTASFGIVVSEDKNSNIENLLSQADRNLYKAKEDGRNLVVINDAEPMPEPVKNKIDAEDKDDSDDSDAKEDKNSKTATQDKASSADEKSKKKEKR